MGYTAVATVHPSIKLWMELSDALGVAAYTGARRAHAIMRRPYSKAGCTRRPGANSPMWNVCATLLRRALQTYGAKARLARYLGVPRQRLNDYLTGRSRLPDAELTLRMLHWLTEFHAGRDLSL
ncbi:MAG TPA: hypothetical protein VG838_04385 [Opitutaceae bacterium]|nr:hypothetical protein [Opitutaceae bacterium]